jgi:3-hydroxybutyryl-CoA dehydrogenase
VQKGKLDSAAREGTLSRIACVEPAPGSNAFAAFAGCTMIVEAVVEDLRIKQDVFTSVGAVVGAGTVLATNTSSLSIAAIARGCPRPERVVGVHFFNPAPVLPLVEIVPWLGTSTAVTERTRALVDSWGKTTVLAADTPGFIVNRVARPFYGEALRIHDEGIADCATIDGAMKELGGFRMGPFELMDFIGNDVNFTVTKTMFESCFWEPRYRPSLTQQRLVEAGRLGRKTGEGFFQYGAPGASRPADGARGTADAARAVFERILAMLINEAADAVFWRVASVDDIDLAMTKGVNYPKGLLAWSDELGPTWAYDRLVHLQDEYGEDRYRPSALLRRMARERGRFHQ